MVLRDKRVHAVIIGSKKVGEIHKLISIISPEIGFQSVMVYGGRKGRKASSGVLFSYGFLFLHYDPVKKYYSLIEDECCFTPSGIMTSINAVLTASALCEMASSVKTDNYQEIYDILTLSFNYLSNNTESFLKVIIDFSWKLLLYSGNVPYLLSICPSCSRDLKEDEELCFSNKILNFTCTSCADDYSFKLLPGSRRYLSYTSEMSMPDVFSVKLSDQAQLRLFYLLTKHVELMFGISLNSLKNLSITH